MSETEDEYFDECEEDMDGLDPQYWEWHMGGPEDEELEGDVDVEIENGDAYEEEEEDEEEEDEEEEDDEDEEDEVERQIHDLCTRSIALKEAMGRVASDLAEAKEALLLHEAAFRKRRLVDGYRIQRCHHRRYRYSETLQQLEMFLKQAKRREVAEGTAELVSDEPYILIARQRERSRRQEPAEVRPQERQVFSRAGAAWQRAEERVLHREVTRGTSLAELASRLRRPPQELRERWRQLSTDSGTDAV